MYEIEAKVKLSDSEYFRLKKELPKMAVKLGQLIKKDQYYGDLKKTFFLRIRQQDKKNILNIKSKQRGEGIEFNQEIELPLKSIGKFNTFLKKIDIPLVATKEKKSNIYKQDKATIELNFIKKLGYFLEIEIIVQTKKEIFKAKKSLLELFYKLGFTPDKFEKKYYLELLNQ